MKKILIVLALLLTVSQVLPYSTENDTIQGRKLGKFDTALVRMKKAVIKGPTHSAIKSDSVCVLSKDTLKTRTLNELLGDVGAGDTVMAGTGIAVTHVTGAFQVALYALPTIVSLTNTEATHYAGQTVTGLTVNWTLAGAAISSQALTDCTPLLADRSHVFTSLSLTTDKYYTLTIDTGTTVVGSATTWVYFKIATFYGASTNAAPTESNIEAGTTTWETQDAVNRALANTAITGGGNYPFYAFPSAWGTVALTVGGLPATWNVTTVSITNSYGDTRNYSVYTSPNTTIGTIYLQATGN
jgi:hypothetical protein